MKPSQCQGVIAIICDLRFTIYARTANPNINHNISDLGRRNVLHGDLRCADGRTLALVPPQDKRAGDVDGRIGAGDNADQEGKGEVVDFTLYYDLSTQPPQLNRIER